MSTELLLVLLSPLLLLVLVGGVVAVVALNKADSKDVPEVARVWCSLFRKLAERTPKMISHTTTTDSRSMDSAAPIMLEQHPCSGEDS